MKFVTVLGVLSVATILHPQNLPLPDSNYAAGDARRLEFRRKIDRLGVIGYKWSERECNDLLRDLSHPGVETCSYFAEYFEALEKSQLNPYVQEQRALNLSDAIAAQARQSPPILFLFGDCKVAYGRLAAARACELVGTSDAIGILRRLGTDRSRMVANYANEMLRHISRRRTRPKA